MDHPAKSANGCPLHTQVVIGLVVGGALGISANLLGGQWIDPRAEPRTDRFAWLWQDANTNGIADGVDTLALEVAKPLGTVFLRLILMVVVPLVVSALALGVVGVGDVRKLGRIGLRTLFLTAMLSSCAVLLGVGLVNLLGPGRGIATAKREQLAKQYSRQAHEVVEKTKQAKAIKDVLLDLIPENPLAEMVGAVDGRSPGNGMLAVMTFALFLGIAMTLVEPAKIRVLHELLEALFALAMLIIALAMKLAPYAVACLVFSLTATLGLDILWTLLAFALTVLLGLGIQLVVVYSLLVWWLGKMNPRRFFAAVQDAMLTAFGTSSSNATLPTAMRVAEENLKLPKDITNFVLTVGATGNQNGTALYEGVVVLFLAQVFGVDLTVGQQIMVVLMSVLAGIGTVGVPGGSIPMIVVVMRSVGVPAEGIAIILGIDRILDMCRTVLNVTGDLALATCVSRWENASDDSSSRR